jgi:hypothetical protein
MELDEILIGDGWVFGQDQLIILLGPQALGPVLPQYISLDNTLDVCESPFLKKSIVAIVFIGF